MLHRVRNLSTALVLIVLSATSMADEPLRKDYSDEELIEMLKDGGYRSVELIEERVIRISIDGSSHVLYVYDDGDLQLYFGLTGYVVDSGHMNEWNRTMRLSRAYIDDVDDPVLEADLLANAGYTARQVTEFVSVFSISARQFHQFVIENDQAD